MCRIALEHADSRFPQRIAGGDEATFRHARYRYRKLLAYVRKDLGLLSGREAEEAERGKVGPSVDELFDQLYGPEDEPPEVTEQS